jgi:transcriptional regulator with XRE-family HTH domain
MALALRAGVSTRHLGFVELGKSRPSPQLILDLARSLDVPLRERNDWLLSLPATHRDTRQVHFREPRCKGFGATSSPFSTPTTHTRVAVDRCWDVQLTNRAARGLVEGIPAEVRGTPTNIFRAALHPHGLAPLTSNFDDWSAYLLGQLHYLANHDPLAADLAREVEAWPGLPPRSRWAKLDAGQIREPVLQWAVNLAGVPVRMYTVMARIGATCDVTLSELTVELFYPSDPVSEEWLRNQCC